MFSFFSRKKNEKVQEQKVVVAEPVPTETPSLDGKKSLKEQSDWLISNGWIKEPYDKSKKTILIMDDREEIISSIIDDLKSLDSSDTFFIDDYNILTVFTKMAGFDVISILEEAPDIEIHYALLDIVLGGKKIIDGVKTMVDGVDVAIRLFKRFPSIDILFFSGCIIESSDDPTHFKNKFDTYTGDDLNNYIMAKDIAFEDELKKLSEFFNGF